MNYKETMLYLESIHMFGVKTGHNRINRLLELLGNPHKELKFLHIAGTNGKGSITAMVNNVLCKSGYKVGMFTSPFIEYFEERIQINNINIEKEKLASIITNMVPFIEQLKDENYDPPTYFEVITCAALVYFYNEKVDFAIMEVGMGGRLDPTNIITPLVSVIASISYDHMEFLGNSLDKIAMEKSGIIKANTPVIVYPQVDEVMKVIEKRAEELNSNLVKVNKTDGKFLEIVNIKENGSLLKKQKLLINTKTKVYEVVLNLLGSHQIMNCAVAINIIETMQDMGIKISRENIIHGLETVFWKGRLEILKSNPFIVIDGAHNIDAILKLKENIKRYFKFKNLFLILGIVKDKEVEKMVEIIAPMAKSVIAVAPHSTRATIAKELYEIIIQYNKNSVYFEDYNEAYIYACDNSSEDDLILICGSFYMIGDMRKIILQKNKNS